jgi:hypothetical protein
MQPSFSNFPDPRLRSSDYVSSQDPFSELRPHKIESLGISFGIEFLLVEETLDISPSFSRLRIDFN